MVGSFFFPFWVPVAFQLQFVKLQTNILNPKIGGLGRCFSFSFWRYFQVPCASFPGCNEISQKITRIEVGENFQI